ncbi:MAG: cyclic pyranopterin monophosphate synthase MoaC [Candidatus Nanopelagicales bacterium]
MNDVNLTHLDEAGNARMVDVSGKEVTVRQATATARVHMAAQTVALLHSKELPKGDALAITRVAGIMAAKRTPDLIPLCHPVAIHGVDVSLELGHDFVDITATVRTADRTGVEMEALTSVSVAALTLIDMVKGVDRTAWIAEVKVVEKTGGRSGAWQRQ